MKIALGILGILFVLSGAYVPALIIIAILIYLNANSQQPNYINLTKSEICDELDKRGIIYNKSQKRAELLDLLMEGKCDV